MYTLNNTEMELWSQMPTDSDLRRLDSNICFHLETKQLLFLRQWNIC